MKRFPVYVAIAWAFVVAGLVGSESSMVALGCLCLSAGLLALSHDQRSRGRSAAECESDGHRGPG